MAKLLPQKFFEQTAQFCKGLSTCTHNTFSFERSPNRPSGNVESVLSWRYLSDVKIGHSNDTPKGENAYEVIWSVGGNWHFSVTKMKICGKHCLRKRVLVIDLYKIYCRLAYSLLIRCQIHCMIAIASGYIRLSFHLIWCLFMPVLLSHTLRSNCFSFVEWDWRCSKLN